MPDSPARVAAAASPLGWPVAHVATRVGVSISTLRSWERRYGLGPSGRTGGGHRRYTIDDIAAMLRLRRFVSDGMSTAAAAAAVRTGRGHPVTPTAADPVEQQFLAAADALEAPAIAHATRRLLVERGVVATWVDVLAPFLQRIGAEFESTGTGIECEHVAVSAILAAIDRWAWEHRSMHDAASVLLAAVEGDHHTLPLNVLAAALAERGVSACVLGSLPESALLAGIARLGGAERIRAVVVWSCGFGVAGSTPLRRLRTSGLAVLAAGPGWPSRLPKGTRRLPTLPAAVNVLTDGCS